MGFEASVAGLLLAIPSVALMIGSIPAALSGPDWVTGACDGSGRICVRDVLYDQPFTQHTCILFIAVTLLCIGILWDLLPPNMNQILGQSKKDEEGVGSSIMTTMKNSGKPWGSP